MKLGAKNFILNVIHCYILGPSRWQCPKQNLERIDRKLGTTLILDFNSAFYTLSVIAVMKLKNEHTLKFEKDLTWTSNFALSMSDVVSLKMIKKLQLTLASHWRV